MSVVNFISFHYFILKIIYESNDFNVGIVDKKGFFLPVGNWTNYFLKSLLQEVNNNKRKPKPVFWAVLLIKNIGIL